MYGRDGRPLPPETGAEKLKRMARDPWNWAALFLFVIIVLGGGGW